jgi:hypothetical protein
VLSALGVYGELPRVAHYTHKRRFGPSEGLTFSSERVPLRRVYVLQPSRGQRPRIDVLCARDAIMALLGQTYVLDVSDRKGLAERFASVCSASAVAEVRRLSYPRTLSALSRVREAIVADLTGR